MKRVLYFLLAAVLLVTLITAPTQAATDLHPLLKKNMQAYYSNIELMHDYFGPGELPTRILHNDLRNACFVDGELSQYFDYTRLDNGFVIAGEGQIPADVVESFMGRHISDKDALLTWMRGQSNDGINDWYYENGIYYFHYTNFGGFGDYYPDLIYLGYQDLGNNTYGVYGYRVDTMEPYVPEEYDVEGKDYLISSYSYSQNGATYTGVSCYEILDEGVYAIMTLTDDSYTFAAFQLIDMENIPANLLKPNAQAAVIRTQLDGVTLTADPRETGIDLLLHIAPITDSSILNLLSGAPIGNASTVFAAYDLTATDTSGQPLDDFHGPVELRIPIPAGCVNPAVYYISADRSTAEMISGKVEGSEYVCSLSHFSTYILTGSQVPVIPEDPKPTDPVVTTPSGTIPTQTEPNATDPTEIIPLETTPDATEPTESIPDKTDPNGTNTPNPSSSVSTAPSQSKPTTDKTQEPSSPAVTIIIVVILVLAVGGVAVGYWLTRKKK